MSQQERIGVFFSVGSDYIKVLKTVRARHPEAHITAVAPPGFDLEGVDVDDTLRMEVVRYRPWNIGRLRRLSAQLRAGCFDRFIVLFPSMKLKAVASLTGARRCECWGMDGRIRTFPPSVARNLTGELTRRLSGLGRFASLWVETLLRPVKKR